jgi:L-asparaginase II
MNPVLVEVVRGACVESIHRGAACVVDDAGSVVESWGDIDALICPRSSLKPLQALALLESGAASASHVTDAELALACASHSGESEHVARVKAWLQRLGLSADDLACGAHPPSNASADAQLIREGRAPSALHNNCSGKHTGFLCCALHMGATTRGYVAPEHPVQQKAAAVIGQITGFSLRNAPVVIDGCSAPNWFMPLRALALGWARLGAITPIVDAMKAHPFLVSGSGRACAHFIRALAGRGIVKTGAEGVYAAALPERKLGVAIKIDDGAGRAASIALAAVLDHLGAFRTDASDIVASLRETPTTAWAGAHTGVIRAASGWLT